MGSPVTVHDVVCPVCGAGKGWACRNHHGVMDRPHLQRRLEVNRIHRALSGEDGRSDAR